MILYAVLRVVLEKIDGGPGSSMTLDIAPALSLQHIMHLDVKRP